MSSRSDRLVTYVVVDEWRDPGLDELVREIGPAVAELRVTGAPGDGRQLLEAIALSDQVLFSGYGTKTPEASGAVSNAYL